MEQNKLFDIANSEDTESDNLAPVRKFIEDHNLGKGFAKKSLDFFYFWYTITHNGKITLQEFRKAFPSGPFVYFSMDKLNIPKEKFGRIVIEYETKKLKEMRKKARDKAKSAKVPLSKPKNEYTD
jgi:hypothetical protein